MNDLKIFGVEGKQQWDEWNKIVEDDFENEPMLKPYYIELFCDKGDIPVMFLFFAQNGKILYPLIKRHIPFRKDKYDVISVYGYGGPNVSGSVNQAEWKEFWRQINEWYMDNDVVTEVVKFNLFDNDKCMYPGTIERVMNNIVCDVDGSFEECVSKFDRKVRKNVRKAERNDLRIEIQRNGDNLKEFLKIYYGTMQRREADEKFYFTEDFFETLHSKMEKNFCYFYVYKDDRVISAELVLLSDKCMYSYLGGTDQEYFDMRPNDFLKYHIIKWGNEHLKKYFVLGGGHGCEDGIYNYKKSFAPDGQRMFCVGTKIINLSDYNKLCACAGVSPDEQFVPAYRK